MTETPSHKPTVLFVCHHNANRSQLAAGYLHHLAGDRINVISAGPTPAGELNPAAVEVMREEGIDISTATPTALDADTLAAADVVITLGCADAVPQQPGKRVEEWSLDGGNKGPDAARDIRDQIRLRVDDLAADLLS